MNTNTHTSIPSPIDGRRIGRHAHILIGELLASGKLDPKPLEIITHVARHSLLADVGAYHLAAKQRLATCVAIYFSHFAPPADWTLLGAEVASDGIPVDLVFETAQTEVVFDEIKSGLPPVSGQELVAHSAQLERQLSAGVQCHSDRFLGVRVCLLAAPRRSYMLLPDRSRRPLYPEVA